MRSFLKALKRKPKDNDKELDDLADRLSKVRDEAMEVARKAGKVNEVAEAALARLAESQAGE